MTPEAISAFAECGSFYRDSTLPEDIFKLYRVGQLFREPTLCDATHKFGGFTASHRYLIISANAKDFGTLSENSEWGLYAWVPGSIFKVLGIATIGNFSQITLLEIPEFLREEFTTAKLSEMETRFAIQSFSQYFAKALLTEPLPEHQSLLWLRRLNNPLGIGEDRKFFESWNNG